MWLNCKLINSEFHITLLDSSKNPEAYLDPMLQQYTFWLSSCFFFPCVCWLDFPHFPYFQASSRSPKWDLSLSCLPAAEQKVKLTSQSLIWPLPVDNLKFYCFSATSCATVNEHCESVACVTYLQVKELAVSPVDDMGSGVGVCDIDEVHLVREAQTRETH